jgi:hypothetical protein
MNLISCNGCAVVLDKDKLKFPKDVFLEDDSIDPRYGQYNQDTGYMEVYIPCPICGEEVFNGRI